MAEPREIIDLGGEWQLVLDPACEGLQRGWVKDHFPDDRAVITNVPGLWNLTYPDYEGVAFYRKTFQVGDEWNGGVCLIQFEGVSYRGEAWLNGIYLGNHEGAYTPFWFDLTQALRPGEENKLVMRVSGLSKTGPVEGVLLKHVPTSKQSWYFTHGGLWGNVRLEKRPWIRIQALALEPDLLKEMLRVEVTLHNRLFGVQENQLDISIVDPAGEVVNKVSTHVPAPPGLSRHSLRLNIPSPRPWSCETSHLYRVCVKAVSPDSETDYEQANFGMRDFTIRDGQFFLNGEPIFLRGVLLQPHYPVAHVVPPNVDMMRREITLMKEAGFNMIRCHLRPAPPGFLDLADQLGMMVYAETSLAWIRESPGILAHGEREIRELIQRDRNHPSVVIWGILGENPPASIIASDYFMSCVRALDTTRVVIDNSGSALTFDQDFGWIDRAYVLPEREVVKEKIIDIHAYLGNFIPEGVYEWLRGVGGGAASDGLLKNDLCSPTLLKEFDRELRSYNGMIFVSELGGGGIPDLEKAVAQFGDQLDLVDAKEMIAFRDGLYRGFYERGLDMIFGSISRMSEASQELQAGGDTRQIEALLCNPRISGFGLTQLSDAAWEFHAGILDLWRNPKQAYHSMKKLNRPDCLVLKASSPVVECEENVSVRLTLTSRGAHRSGGHVVVDAIDEDQCLINRLELAAPDSAGIHDLGKLVVKTGTKPGQYRVSARLEREGEIFTESNENFVVLTHISLVDVLQSTGWITPPAGLEGEEGNRVFIYPAKFDPGNKQERVVIAPAPAQLSSHQWETILDYAGQGGTAVIGSLHRNNLRALEILQSKGVNLRLEVGIGSWVGCYHWIPASPLFTGLPNAGFAGEAYVDLLPHYVMKENGGKVLAGSIRSKYTVDGAAEILWYSDIEAIPFGRGELVFCQYRCFDYLGKHPIARRLYANLVFLILGWKKEKDGKQRISQFPDKTT
jgi:beta-galactosidase